MKRIRMSRDIKWADWVPTNTKELTMYDVVDKSPGVEENDDLVDLPAIEQGGPLPVLEWGEQKTEEITVKEGELGTLGDTKVSFPDDIAGEKIFSEK